MAPRAAQESKRETNLGSLTGLGSPRVENTIRPQVGTLPGKLGHSPAGAPSPARSDIHHWRVLWPGAMLWLNIAAARAVDREFNYSFGSNLGLFSSGRDSNGRGAPVGFVWAEFQLKRSHDRAFRAQYLVFV